MHVIAILCALVGIALLFYYMVTVSYTHLDVYKRQGMESVYTLLDIDRGVPEVWGSKYDVREILRACYYAIDKKPLLEAQLPFAEKELMKLAIKKVKGTDLELLLKESGLIQ